MSNHAVEVVPVVLEPHPNADVLSIVKVWGYQVCVRTEDWVGVAQGAYIPPDSIVPDTEQFEFLEGHRRIRAKKLRGQWSMGMMVPAPEGSGLGDDVADTLGITHYEPPIKGENQQGVRGTYADAAPSPEGVHPKYDVENIRRYNEVLIPGEEVVVH